MSDIERGVVLSQSTQEALARLGGGMNFDQAFAKLLGHEGAGLNSSKRVAGACQAKDDLPSVAPGDAKQSAKLLPVW